MKKNIEEIKKSIKANGSSSSAQHHDKEMMGYVMSAIELYRMRFTVEEIFHKLSTEFPLDDYLAGRRFKENIVVAYRFFSAVNNAFIGGGYDLKKPEDLEEINNFIKNLSGSDMNALILDSLRDCASADHWYTYEKQW